MGSEHLLRSEEEVRHRSCDAAGNGNSVFGRTVYGCECWQSVRFTFVRVRLHLRELGIGWQLEVWKVCSPITLKFRHLHIYNI